MAKDTPQEFHTLKEFTDELDLLFRDDVALRKLLQKARNWCIRNNRAGDEEEVLQEAVMRVMKSEIMTGLDWNEREYNTVVQRVKRTRNAHPEMKEMLDGEG